MSEIKRKGGAKVGWVNASWPLASLSVNVRELSLKVALSGTYNFSKEQIIGIEKHLMFPVLAWGIKIRHNVESYPEQVIFYTLGHPNKLLSSISTTGFSSEGGPSTSTAAGSAKRGFPLRIIPLVIVVVLWNLLFLADQTLSSKAPGQPSTLAVLALALVFAAALLIKTNQKIAKLFLKPGRYVGEISPTLNLLLLVSGLMSVGFSAMLLMGGQ